MRRSAPLAAAGLLALAVGARAATPLDLTDATPRGVVVRLERGSPNLAADLLLPHEGFGDPLPAELRYEHGALTVTLPAASIEAELGAIAVPGSTTDAIVRIDPTTRAVSVGFAFSTPIFFAVEGPHDVTVLADTLGGEVGFLPSFRSCDGPPRCTPAASEPYDPATGRFLAVGSASVAGLGAAVWKVDGEILELDAPAGLAALRAHATPIPSVGPARGSAARSQHALPPGPYGAGARYEQITRFVGTGTPRGLDVAVWYPTADPAWTPASPIEQDLLAALDAPPHPEAVGLPSVVFSHGHCGSEAKMSHLLAALARAGFVAAAPAHAGDTVIDPDCEADVGTAIAQRPADLEAVLDALLAWNEDPAWPLAGAIDPGRIGAMGLSLGALSTTQRAAVDPRLHAVVLVAAPFFPTSVLLPLAVPAMVQGGRLDTTLPFDTEQTPLYEGLLAPRFLVGIDEAGHSTFATQCQTPFDDCVPGGQSAAEVHALVQRYAEGFLTRYLAGDPSGDALLVPVPGATLEAEPAPEPSRAALALAAAGGLATLAGTGRPRRRGRAPAAALRSASNSSASARTRSCTSGSASQSALSPQKSPPS
jgi:predicted dienelactone hydrolase